jgi:exodeoxyribonuclease-3
MKIATWNVNSVKSRLPQLLEWLKRDGPDIVLLQEIKCIDETFPSMEIEDLGYNLAIHGEKTYNGVAILSRFKLDDICKGLPGNEADTHSRYIEAVASMPGGAMRVASVYVPNGQSPDSEKFPYKLGFLDHLQSHMKNLLAYDERWVIGGDYNIAPADIDVHDVQEWEGTVLTHKEVRYRFRKMEYLGVCDAWRLCHPKEGGFSWWDYRANSFARDNGLRIDMLMISPQAAGHLKGCVVEKTLRAAEKASDHTPVVAEFT